MASEEVNNIKAEVSLVGSGLKMTIRREKPVADSLPSNTEWISETRGNGLGKLVLKRKSGSVTASPSSGLISSSCSPGVKKVEPGERNIIRLSFISSPEDGSQIAQIKQLSSSSCDVTSDEGVGELSPACHLQPSPKDSGIDVSSPPHDDGHVVNYGQIVTVNGCDTEQNNTGVLDRLTVDQATSDVSAECLPVIDSESLYYSGASELKSWESLSKVQSTLRTKAERTAEPVPAANGCRERRIFKSRQRNTNGSTPVVPVYCSTVYTVSSVANSNRKRRLAPDESSTYNLPPKKHGEKVVERVILKIKQGSIVTPSAKSIPKDMAGKKGRSSNKDAIKLTVAKVSKSSVNESGNTADNLTENKESTADGCVEPENKSRGHIPRLTTKIRVAELKKSITVADDGHVVDAVPRKRKNKESKTSHKSSDVNKNVSCRDSLSLPKAMDPPVVDSNESIAHTGNRTVENVDIVLFDTTPTHVENEQSSCCNTVSVATLPCNEKSAVVEALVGERVSPSFVEREIGPSEGCSAYNYESSSALQHCDPGGSPFNRVEGSIDSNIGCSLESPVVCREIQLTSSSTSEEPLKAVGEQGGCVVHYDNLESHTNDSSSAANHTVNNLSVSCINTKGLADTDCKKKSKKPPGGIKKGNKFSAMRSSVKISWDKLSTDDDAACKLESKNSQLSHDHVDCRNISASQHSAMSVPMESTVSNLSENVSSSVAREKLDFWSFSVEAVEQPAANACDETSYVRVLHSSKPLDASNDEPAGLCKTYDKANSQDAEYLPTCLPVLSMSGSYTLTLEDSGVNANKSDCPCDFVTSVSPASQVVSCSNADLTGVVSMHPAASCTDQILTVDARTAALSNTADSVESIADDSLLLLKNSQVKVADSSTLFGPLRIESHVDIDESVMVVSNVQAGISPSLSVANTKSLSPASAGCNDAGKGGFMTEFAKFVHTTFDTEKEVDNSLEIDEKPSDGGSIWMIDMDSHRSADLHSAKLLPTSEVRNKSRVSSGPKSRSIRGRKIQRTAVSKTSDQRSKSDSCSHRRAERSVSLTNLDVNSFMPDHCRLVDLRCKTCDMLSAVFPSLEYPAGFCRESKSVDELIEHILLILNQPSNKTAGINRSEPCSEPFVDICSLPEQCMNRLRRQIVRLMSVLLPGIDLSDIDDIESIEVLLEMITSANAVTPNLAGASTETSATALLSLPGTWPVSLIPVEKPDVSPHCLDVKPEVNSVLQSTFGYISITPNPSITKRTLKRQVKDCLMFLDKDLT